MIGDTIKLSGGDSLQAHIVTRTTKTHAIYGTGSIAKNRLCKVGTFWLEMSPPEATIKTASKKKSQRGKKLSFTEGGEVWGNLPYCAELVGDFKPPILHSWRNCGLVKAQKKDFWFFRVSDIPRACELRDPIGRLVDGRQFYSQIETARRVGVTPGCVGGWVTREHVEVDRPKSAVLVICWDDVVQYCKSIGRKIDDST